MDIKTELEEDIEQAAETEASTDLQWRIYKDEFEETTLDIKSEAPDEEDYLDSGDISFNRDIFKVMGNLKNETDSEWKPCKEEILPIKSERSNEEDSMYSEGKYSSQIKNVPKIQPDVTDNREFACNASDKDAFHSLTDEQVPSKYSHNKRSSRKLTKPANPRKMNERNRPVFKKKSVKRGKMKGTLKKIYKCHICEYASVRRDQLAVHNMVHTGEKPYKCEKCDYSCTRPSTMKVHTMTHSSEKPFKCEECGYMCRRSSNLKVHKMIHSGKKPFKCDKCDYTCKRSSTLKEHKMTHSGGKPFKCDACSYACSRIGTLKDHQLTHSGEKPYKCDKCDYMCTRSGNLKEHIKMTHSGEKPFKCEMCDYTCTRSGHLKLHKKTHVTSKS